MTLGEVFDREPGDDVIIAVNTSHIHRKISGECHRVVLISERATSGATDREPSTDDGMLYHALYSVLMYCISLTIDFTIDLSWYKQGGCRRAGGCGAY